MDRRRFFQDSHVLMLHIAVGLDQTGHVNKVCPFRVYISSSNRCLHMSTVTNDFDLGPLS